jgi:hypothetical protein
LTAVGTGETQFVTDLTWGGQLVRRVELEIFVNERPSLCHECPRRCDFFCDSVEFNPDFEENTLHETEEELLDGRLINDDDFNQDFLAAANGTI